ncbi:Ankyrin repeat and FYVE domain-containing protein 1 [Maublancomyces gigas]|uniref:Ankyrin repeat and FYVE domain-containing protein 1 n=1 Tax=Discina gigas TaxID=1032678 RepID=A0ABR3GFT6_9PEZI
MLEMRPPPVSSQYLMNDILRGTSRAKLINSLLAPPHRKARHGHNVVPDVIFGLVITDSRLDDEQSVAVIEFSDTPAWLQDFNDDPFGFPKKTALGTLWRGVDRNMVDNHGQTEFIRAVIKGTPNLHYAEMLAEFHDTDVNIQDEKGRTALHCACTENLSEIVTLCLSVPDCDIGLKDSDGLTAFDLSMRAASGNGAIPTMFYNSMFEMEETHPQEARLRVLTITSEPASTKKLIFPGSAIPGGIDLTACDIDGDTALHVAAKVGNAETARVLLQAGSDVNARGFGGATPLHYSIHTRDEGLVQALLDGEAESNARDNEGRTALQLAEGNDYEVIVELLKGLGEGKAVGESETTIREMVSTVMTAEKRKLLPPSLGDIAAVNTNRYTPLSQAALDRDLDTIRLLLDVGADMEAKDVKGRTVLHLAAFSGNTDIVSILLNSGVNVQTRDKKGETAMHIAAWKGYADIVTILLTGGTHVEATCNMGWTSLHEAAAAGHVDVLKELLAANAEIEAVIELGRTPLHLAASIGHSEVVKELLAGGAHIETVTKSGRTPLHLASSNGHSEVVKELLAGGAQIEAVDISWETSLHLAALSGHTEVVKELLGAGAQIETRSTYRTALQLAARAGEGGDSPGTSVCRSTFHVCRPVQIRRASTTRVRRQTKIIVSGVLGFRAEVRIPIVLFDYALSDWRAGLSWLGTQTRERQELR